MIDLHTHTTASDGLMTPRELLDEAQQVGVRYLAITDHDSIDGYLAIREESKQAKVRVLPGIEWNTDGPDGELHILGYGFDIADPRLHYIIDRRKQERIDWAKEIVGKCRQLGMEIPFADCLARAKGGVVVRTHIAEVLVSHGYGTDPREVFGKLLQKGCPAYVPRPVFTAREAIELTREIGGIAILAHPGIYPFEFDFKLLVEYGIDGVEVYHAKHSPEQTTKWEREAQQYNLIRSGGSDFHGYGSRNPHPIGSVDIPPEVKEWWTCFMSHQP
ncbi:PHP domain-containing protein [Brevibacillus massiliensis]|uniref:PHP domain-containing protein n=1 Tax=Brevibacillus massiliensis TaxID=1118054 RepID=UPI0002F8BFD8|nr:PHP domain-containing protein [Brevibacillus massiliensis]